MRGVIVLAGIVWLGPKLTPQEAADILRPNQTRVAPTCTDCNGPRVFVIGSSVTSGPYGVFPPYPVQRPLTCCGVYRVTRHGMFIR